MKTNLKHLTASILAACFLTGCTPAAGPSGTDAAVSEETFLIGLNGKGVFLSDIRSVTLSDGTEISGDSLTLDSFNKDNFFSAECEGFCYLADPLGIAANGIDNAGAFKDPGMGGTIGADFDREFKRYNVGDKYGDLTVKEATVTFNADAYNIPCFGWDPMVAGKDIDFPEVFYEGQYVAFDGEVSLTGYLMVNENSDYFPDFDGVMEFVVDDKSNVLPVAYAQMSLDDEGGFFTSRYATYMGIEEDYTCFIDEYASIYLGGINDTEADTSGLNTNYPHFSKVKVTLKNIVMPVYHETPSGSSYIQADVKELEVLK